MSRAPFAHQVIRASAGSGKTHQLTNRYLGLLAAGVEPDAILATTFTRKAAGEILDRVMLRLAKAAADANEAADLAEQIEVTKNPPEDFAALLRRMVRSLHRVRIGTLDSFYIALADSFSLELGLPAGWSICEPADDDALREEALERLLEREEADILTALYQRLTQGHPKRGVRQELLEIIQTLFGIHTETGSEVWNRIAVATGLSPAKLGDLLTRIEAFDLSKNAGMQRPRTEDLERVRLEKWKDLLVTGLCGKVFSEENAFRSKPIPERLIALYRDLVEHARHVLVLPVAEQTSATREFLEGFHAELRLLKRATGALRFNDITRALVGAKGLPAVALAFRLDGGIDHLLLDEFQDTALAQWLVLQPIALAITRGLAESPRSFFCVGDVKQAIFGWRGGLAEIIDTLPDSLGELQRTQLVESRRSAPPIIEVVNLVFGNLGQFQAGDKNQDGLTEWGKRFEKHATVKKDAPGYVSLNTGPAQADGQGVDEQRGQHCVHVAEKIRDLRQQSPWGSIGVLCRKNDAVARMIYELRRLGVEASEEGGNPLTDSPAVELMLSLFKLADHPGHSVAWFHLQNSPLQEHCTIHPNADAFSQELRRRLLGDGYGKFAHEWAKRVAHVCNRRDLSRLQQLVEMAYAYQARSTLRAGQFVAWVRQQKVSDPSAASVRVMTIHVAKGLEFDTVVLPELDSSLAGRAPAFVVGRDPRSLDVNFVCRYADETVQGVLSEDQRRAFQQNRRQRVEESLSLLYVALTRARNALHLFIPGPRFRKESAAWYNLLLQTLAPGAKLHECDKVCEFGTAKWFQHIKSESVSVTSPRPQRTAGIVFRPAETGRSRGLEHVAPSRREGKALVPLDRLFKPSEGTGTAAGTLYHAWFETIGWLEDDCPTDAALRTVAEKLRRARPTEHWPDVEPLLAHFRAWLQNPAINGVLRRSAYTAAQRPEFPAALAPYWTISTVPLRVERERRFLVRDDSKFWNGSLDRIVWLGDGERIIAADVIDYKSDAILPGNEAALAERIEHYRPQLEAYRNAVAKLAQLPPNRVATRLLFTFAGCVKDV